MAEPRIDVDGLPLGVSGPYDTVVGVNEATGAARRFPMPQPGTPRSYATRASLPAASGFTEGYTVWVSNDPTPANNGTWAVLGGVWVQSADRVTGLEGKIGDVVATLSADVMSIGYAGTIPDGTGAAGASTYTFAVPITKANRYVRFAYFGRSSGTAHLQVVSRAGVTNTVVREVAVSIAPGYHEFNVELEHEAGQYFGLRTASALLPVSSGNPGFGYWSVAGQVSQGSSYDDASVSTSIFHVRLVSYGQIATGASVKELQASRDSIKEVLGVDGGVGKWLGGIGSALPVDGSAISFRTYAVATAADRDYRVAKIRAYVRVPGSITLRRFTKSGDTFTAIGDDLVIQFGGTGQVEVEPPAPWVLKKGEYYAIANATNIVSVTATTPADGGYYDGAANATSFTDAAPTSAYTIQVGVELEPFTVLERLERVESAAPDALPIPDSFIVVWGLGESHMAGRGGVGGRVLVPSGVAYKYTRSTASIDYMADPTGNDGSEAGSFGPALAEAVWRATDGRLGVILVNSGLGSSRIGNQWAAGNSGWTLAAADWTDAVAKIRAARLPVVGVVAYLAIGSNDAAVATEKVAFKAAVLDLYSRVRAAVGAGDQLPMILAQTGDFTDGSHAAAVQAIRDAQNELVADNATIFMGWAGAKYFVAKGMMSDNVHYTQAGNNMWGRSTAAHVIAKGVGCYPAGLG